MAKFHGVVGYVLLQETSSGVWDEIAVEKSYYGEILKSNRYLQQSGGVNDNVTVSNQISIVSTHYAIENIYAMRYVIFRGTKWKITNVEVQYPRLILTIGGVYNGQSS